MTTTLHPKGYKNIAPGELAEIEGDRFIVAVKFKDLQEGDIYFTVSPVHNNTFFAGTVQRNSPEAMLEQTVFQYRSSYTPPKKKKAKDSGPPAKPAAKKPAAKKKAAKK